MKAVLYARVSSKDQERDGFSIPAQKKLLREYAEKNNLEIACTFEEAETAKRAGRKEFDRMLSFLRDNPEIKDVLVEKTDRLYRNFKDYSLFDFEQLNLRVHLVKEGELLSKDSRSHQKFIHGIKVLMAKNYSDNLSEEVRKGQLEKASRGVWPSNAPIGYRNILENHTIAPHPTIAPLIVRAFEMAASGQYSLNGIRIALYDEGLRSARAGNQLGKSALARILSNSIYYGPFTWAGKTYPGVHASIISKDLFDRAQIAMGKVQKPRVTKNRFTFSGTLTCGHCGCAVTAERKTKKSGKTFVYYHCTNGKGLCTNVSYLREEAIDEAIRRSLEAIKLDDSVIEFTRKALSESHEDERKFHEAAVTNLTTRYKKLQSFIEQCYLDKLEGRIELEMWERKSAEWRLEQSDLEMRLQAHRKANTAYLMNGTKLMDVAARAAEAFPLMTSDEKRQMAHLVLSNPRITNGSLEYDYKMPFSMFVNVTDLAKWRGGRDSNPRPPP